jgi:hypothetical protein
MGAVRAAVRASACTALGFVRSRAPAALMVSTGARQTFAAARTSAGQHGAVRLDAHRRGAGAHDRGGAQSHSRYFVSERGLSSAASGMVDVAAGEREAVIISERCAQRILKVTLPQFVCATLIALPVVVCRAVLGFCRHVSQARSCDPSIARPGATRRLPPPARRRRRLLGLSIQV